MRKTFEETVQNPYILKINGSEFRDEYDKFKIIGLPLGTIASELPALIDEIVACKHPRIIFYEIEKAHPAFIAIFFDRDLQTNQYTAKKEIELPPHRKIPKDKIIREAKSGNLVVSLAHVTMTIEDPQAPVKKQKQEFKR